MIVPTESSFKNNKIIMLLCDGLRNDTSLEEMGYLNSLCNSGIGKRYVSIVDNPSFSWCFWF